MLTWSGSQGIKLLLESLPARELSSPAQPHPTPTLHVCSVLSLPAARLGGRDGHIKLSSHGGLGKLKGLHCKGCGQGSSALPSLCSQPTDCPLTTETIQHRGGCPLLKVKLILPLPAFTSLSDPNLFSSTRLHRCLVVLIALVFLGAALSTSLYKCQEQPSLLPHGASSQLRHFGRLTSRHTITHHCCEKHCVLATEKG